jgi:UvrD/REP helicase N-terminal domain
MKTARSVLAGAGSGKTSVIAGRAGYLVESGQAHPPEVLILAFGDNASQEMDERIGERLPGTQGISTHTFHALGRKIIGQATGRMPSVSVLATNEETFGSYLLETVQQRSQEHKGYGDKVLYYLAAYPQPYRPPDTFESHEAYVRYPRTVRTSSGTGRHTGRTAISIPIWNRIIGGLNNALGPRVGSKRSVPLRTSVASSTRSARFCGPNRDATNRCHWHSDGTFFGSSLPSEWD